MPPHGELLCAGAAVEGFAAAGAFLSMDFASCDGLYSLDCEADGAAGAADFAGDETDGAADGEDRAGLGQVERIADGAHPVETELDGLPMARLEEAEPAL